MDPALMLRAARRREGLTQSELARRAGTSQATVSSYEAGRKTPSVATFSRLLAAAGSRLELGPALRPVVQPTPADWARAASTFEDVLGLAEALPSRHDPELRFPRLGRAGAGSS